MEDLKIEKTDVVREILDNTDLLNIFSESLKDPEENNLELLTSKAELIGNAVPRFVSSLLLIKSGEHKIRILNIPYHSFQ